MMIHIYSMKIHIESQWKEVLTPEFTKPYFTELADFVRNEYITQTVYPPPKELFSAFHLTPFHDVRVVILGQDPYHGPGQAHGLAFSVQNGVKTPPSLQNIYKELYADIGKDIPQTGNLASWATQGVFLLNALLSVRARTPASHHNKGWETFTDAVIHAISTQKKHVVFMLWGAYAQKKGAHIDTTKHLVLSCPHPSPFSADRGFFGCKHFSKANTYLAAHNHKEITW